MELKKESQKRNTNQDKINQKITEDKVDNIIKDKKLFFGWKNIKWFVTEIGKMYSGKSSFFSKKRIESGAAFIIAQWGMIYFLTEKHSSLDMGEFLLWSAAALS